MFHILLIEDDPNTALSMGLSLKEKGYQLSLAANGTEALDLLEKERFDLLILDLERLGSRCYSFAEYLQNNDFDLPLLFLNANELPEENCKAFLPGRDDYMVEFSEKELFLRIKALLLRAQAANQRKLRIGKVNLDCDSLTVSRPEISHTLPQKEFYLLYKLLSCPDRIFTRRQIMDDIWGTESASMDTTVNVHINRLRKRFRDWPEFEIVSIRGMGYKAVIHSR